MFKRTKIDLIFGTRPEAIKMAPIYWKLKKCDAFHVRVINTGQHKEMIRPLFNLFNIKVDCDLDLMTSGQSINKICTQVVSGLNNFYKESLPDRILVQGDTSSAMAAGLFAFHEKIPLGHVEAGLRTGNMHSPWPEEWNRRIISLAADLHFAPTELTKKQLLAEGIPNENLFLTGNTVIDTLMHFSNKLDNEPALLNQIETSFASLNLKYRWCLATVHRRESFGVDLENILIALKKLVEIKKDVRIFFPVHLNPNVRATVNKIFDQNSSWISENKDTPIVLSEPLEYLSFVYWLKRAELIMSDSGGIQEEAPALGKPVLILRKTTERSEAVTSGSAKLIGTDTESILSAALNILNDRFLYNQMSKARNPFGDGSAADRICEVLLNRPKVFNPNH